MWKMTGKSGVDNFGILEIAKIKVWQFLKGLFRFERLYLQNVLPLFGMVNKPSFQQYVSELLGGKILCFLISFQGWVPYPPSSLCHKDHFIIAPAALFSYQVSYSNTTPNVVKSRSDQSQCFQLDLIVLKWSIWKNQIWHHWKKSWKPLTPHLWLYFHQSRYTNRKKHSSK